MSVTFVDKLLMNGNNMQDVSPWRQFEHVYSHLGRYLEVPEARSVLPTRTGPASSRRRVESFLAAAGVRIDGPQPWDIQVHDDRFYDQVLKRGSLGFGDSYMAGWWDCAALDTLFSRLCTVPKARTRSVEKYALKLSALLLNRQTKDRATEVAEAHYNLSNALFERMLDPHMQYSCAYWQDAATLQEAQERKLDLICRKLHLKSSDHVLEIGCGWGGLARYMASRYGCRVTAVNISTEQIGYARRWCSGLPVDVVEADYRDITGTYDKVVSIAMFEAVGPRNYRTFMEVVHRVLRREGVFLLHTIGENITRIHGDRWMLKHIFPNGHIPSTEQIGAAMEGLFVMEDWHNLGLHYDRTLIAWAERFELEWPAIQQLDPKFDARFHRMWRYYLLNCAGSFRARHLNLWQVMMTKARTGTRYSRVACE